LLTASREAPTQLATSSCESGSTISNPRSMGAPEPLAQLHQPLREASRHVERRELRPLSVGVAQPPGDHAQDLERDARTPIQQRQEVRAWDEQGVHRLERRDRGRAWAVFDGGELPDQLTRSDQAEDGLPVIPPKTAIFARPGSNTTTGPASSAW
jgi:hypothetical protein